ncbi:MAG: pantoate--beta-alanine ligase [Acidobacteria bacterium]|nr:pantoate--beta-alanine ligase [Acidobacteriota bacterium]
MIVVASTAEMQQRALEVRSAGRSIGLVPTMGALHEGHLSLVRAARRDNDFVVVSLFVNPTQFGPNEDLQQYPRDFETDRRKLEAERVDALYAPSTEEVYAAGFQTYICVEELGARLDGASRPMHFRGVATVVAKLFNVVQPHRAYFGQKDAAQVAVIRRLVRDLCFPVQLVVCPIIRESDGLAMSSRNGYLNPEERKAATVLYRSLREAEARYREGERSGEALTRVLLECLAAEPLARVDYAAVVDPDSLLPLERLEDPALVAVAGWFGTTRLIDNTLLGESRHDYP